LRNSDHASYRFAAQDLLVGDTFAERGNDGLNRFPASLASGIQDSDRFSFEVTDSAGYSPQLRILSKPYKS
jgi:hypothetical protein